MFNCKIVTTRTQWENIKSNMGLVYSEVPNTATGYERTRCYMTENTYMHKYLISAITEKDFFIHYDGISSAHNGQFSAWFTLDGDAFTINKATMGGKAYTAERYLKKYAQVVLLAACAIVYDKAVEFVPYKLEKKYTLLEWYKTEADSICAKAASLAQREWIGFSLLDAITGENITNDIDYEEWDAVKVDTIEIRSDFVAVYVTF